MENNFTRVKISDVALKAGVSAGTVDRVIHNRGEVALKTREKILKIISEMNYEPDILASTLASKKSYRFVSLIPIADESNPFWASPAEGLQQAWEEIKHFGVTLEKHYFWYYDRNTFSKKLEQIIQNPPSGLILAPIFTEQTVQYMPLLKKLEIPVIFLNTQVENQGNISFVGQAPRYSGMLAAKLLDYGLNDKADIFIINIISEKGGNTHILNRENGFREYFSNKTESHQKQLTTINVNTQDVNKLDELIINHIGKEITPSRSKGIFVTNSKVFHVAASIEKLNLTHINLVGYDLLEQNQQFLRKGIIDFLISQQPREQGYRSLMAMFNHMVMKKQINKNQFLPIDIITKENIDFYLNY